MLLRQSNNVVVLGNDVNLIILLSKRSHHSNAYVSKPRTGDIYRAIQPFQWLPQHQHINSKKKTFKLIHKHPELELEPIGVFQCILFVNNPCHKNGYCSRCILGLFSNKYSSGQITIL